MKAACVKPPHGWIHRTVACTGYTAKPKIPATFLRVRTTVLFKLEYTYKMFNIFTLNNNLYKSCSLMAMFAFVWEETW